MTQLNAATLPETELEETLDTPSVHLFAEEETPETATISIDEIRLLAYLKWEAAGMPCSDGVEFWLEAETELG